MAEQAVTIPLAAGQDPPGRRPHQDPVQRGHALTPGVLTTGLRDGDVCEMGVAGIGVAVRWGYL